MSAAATSNDARVSGESEAPLRTAPRRTLATLPPCALRQRGLPVPVEVVEDAPESVVEVAVEAGPRLDWTCSWECMGHPDTQAQIRADIQARKAVEALPLRQRLRLRWTAWLAGWSS